ncbi:hypothetical protein PIB30_048325 [Stylosanthes scabra]|uniref:Uncharacterized protein n=1 Tax=Stylosanthes scabra TaxID=79078 RepID=A0ABU6ZFR4_9FABA|nr:hypothetical protein [Stylosanthes scabra]
MMMSSSTSASGINNGWFEWKCNLPVEFLFGGLALIFGVIGMALFFLVCCPRRKRRSFCECHTNDNSKHEISVRAELEPDVLVIVAGEKHPTFMAKPLGN